MISELADFLEESGKSPDLVREEQRNGELLQAASYAFDQLTQQQIGEFIRLSCRYGSAKPHEIHRKIVELGPTSFVTTNYDNLIEEALRTFRTDTFFAPPVTNRHLTEMASVAHARKSDFIFKPHGDASDAKSIILTREQYRKLLPQGEWNRALETLKTLMISRPVLYVGFGLRDPDFLYLRDLLANTYEGAVRDHYSILPNVSDLEVDYWRRSYGIQIIPYQTSEDRDGNVIHNGLMDLLDNLKQQKTQANETAGAKTQKADFLLAITRYATRLARSRPPESKLEIGVEYQGDEGHFPFMRHMENSFENVDDLLLNGPKKLILVGLPGAGKSFSMSMAVADMADELQAAALEEDVDLNNIAIPLVVDMKQYGGSLWSLVEESLPSGMSLKALLKDYKLKIFVDSFNEMPKKYWSDASYEGDLNDFLQSSKNASVVIASRTEHGLLLPDFKTFTLESINEEIAEEALFQNGFKPDGVFHKEMVELIRRPFFYRLLQSKAINVSRSTEPRSVFGQIFTDLSKKCEKRFGQKFDLLSMLQELAFGTLNAGTETFSATDAEGAFAASLEEQNTTDIEAVEVLNWLVSEQAIQPLPKGKLAFFHQSITEYLAATRLASHYEENPDILRDVLRFRRWDQAIMQTMMLLPKEKATTLLAQIIKTDHKLALSACKYIEQDRDVIVNDVLEECLAKRQDGQWDNHNLEWAIQRELPLSEYHLPLLRKCIASRSTIGAAAVVRLAEILGSDAKEELLSLLFEGERDFNFLVNGVARALASIVKIDDLSRISGWIENNPTPNKEDDATVPAFASALSNLPAEDILRSLAPELDHGIARPLALEILCSIAQDKRTQEWLDISIQLLPLSLHNAAIAVHFILGLRRSRDAMSADRLREEDIDLLIDGIWGGDEWCLSALTDICRVSRNWSEIVEIRREQVTGLRAAILEYCSEPSQGKSIFDWLEQFAHGELTYGPELSAINYVKLDWADKGELFLRLLSLRDTKLVDAILPAGYPAEIESLGKIDFGDVRQHLEWLGELQNGEENRGLLPDQIASVIGSHSDEASKRRLLAELESPNSPHRRVVSQLILGHCDDLSVRDLSERSISYLFAELQAVKIRPWGLSIFSRIADETFVDERLLPLLSDADDTFQLNLRSILEQIGRRHGRRYFV